MTWWLPLLALGVLSFFAWESRDILTKGAVGINFYVIRQQERPGLFWFLVTVNILSIIAAASVIVLWGLDFNGLRSG